MKLGKLRTLRGQIEVTGGAGKRSIITADGLINYGLKIESFRIWPSVNLATTSKFISILSLDTINAAAVMDAGDNRQIGWNYIDHGYGTERIIIDPDHIVNRDLALNITGTNATYNYLIECRVVELTDDEAIVTIIKETSQS
jgi:hypothetical protein